MSRYSPICWRCRGLNDSAVGTNCLDCREDGTDAMGMGLGILFIILGVTVVVGVLFL